LEVAEMDETRYLFEETRRAKRRTDRWKLLTYSYVIVSLLAALIGTLEQNLFILQLALAILLLSLGGSVLADRRFKQERVAWIEAGLLSEISSMSRTLESDKMTTLNTAVWNMAKTTGLISQFDDYLTIQLFNLYFTVEQYNGFVLLMIGGQTGENLDQLCSRTRQVLESQTRQMLRVLEHKRVW